jgi:hypothetical protein
MPIKTSSDTTIKRIYGNTKGKIQNQSKVPPIDFHAKTGLAVEYSMSGNMTQTGTPTPDAPIMPEECGDRTANLFNEVYQNLDSTIKYISIQVGDGTFTLSTDMDGALNRDCCLFFLAGQVTGGANYSTNGCISGTSRTVTSSGGYVTIGYRLWSAGNPSTAHTMLNSGSTALPYEPFGYKITLNL